jgi:hypothetical protein
MACPAALQATCEVKNLHITKDKVPGSPVAFIIAPMLGDFGDTLPFSLEASLSIKDVKLGEKVLSMSPNYSGIYR